MRMKQDLTIRKAKKKDLPSVLSLIKELAKFERAPKEVKVTVKELERDGFGKKKYYHCFVAETAEKRIVGIALYYIKYSTWKGKCIYLDDIVVTRAFRGHGIGKKLFEQVIDVAKKMKVRKVEWQVLNWNEPAIDFYKKYSTVFDNEWINCKLVFE